MLAEKTAETNRALGIVPPIVPSAPDDIKSAAIIGPWRLRVVFNDGVEGEIDIERFVNSPDAGSFALLRDPELFEKAFLYCGFITWPTGNDEFADLDLAFHGMYEAIKATGLYAPA